MRRLLAYLGLLVFSAAVFVWAYHALEDPSPGRDAALGGAVAVFLLASQFVVDADARRAQERHERKVLEILATLEAKIDGLPTSPLPQRRPRGGALALMLLIVLVLRTPRRT